MSYPPCRYARRWPELWAQQPTDNDRRILSSILASGRLDSQEPSRAFVAAFIDRTLGRITPEEFLAGDHHLPPCTRTDYQPAPTPTNPPPPTHSSAGAVTNHPQRAGRQAGGPHHGRCATRCCRATATRCLAPEHARMCVGRDTPGGDATNRPTCGQECASCLLEVPDDDGGNQQPRSSR